MTVPSGPRHAAEDEQWYRSDAWVLGAVRVCGSVEHPGNLFDLVAACDAVNHLIAARHEIEHAIGMLLGAGLVIADEQGFAVTGEGRALVAEAGKAAMTRGGLGAAETRAEELHALLHRYPPRRVPWSLDPRDYEAACLEYQHTRWREFRRPPR